jgi:class 3 adenylate cyclase/CHASE2 domain-containing sensor protein
VLAAVAVGLLRSPVPPDGVLLDLLVWSRDLMVPYRDQPEASPVAVVALDQRSLDEPDLARFPRALMTPVWAALLDGVFASGARAVGFDVLFIYNANQFSPDFDSPWLAALDRHRERVVLARSSGALPAPSVLAVVRHDPAALGLIVLPPDADGRYRRVRARYATVDDREVVGFAAALLHRAGAPPSPDEMVLAPRRHLERIPTYAVADVLRCAQQAPEVLARALSGKVVLVGGTLADEDRRVSSDRFLRPAEADAPVLHPCGLRRLGASDPDSASVPGVFLHAAAVEAVLTGRVTRTVSTPARALLAAATGGTGAALAMALTPWMAGAAIVLIAVGIFVTATAALAMDLWLPLALPLGALAAAAALAYVVRYLVEERTRRRIQHAFSHYLSPAIVDRLATDASALRLGGERREITVMFADLSGFTALSGTVEPEVLTSLTNQYLGYIVEEVEATGGYVDKFIGDAVLALWGAPVPDPEHAVHAVRAAMAAVAHIRAEHDAAQAKGERGFSVKIGLNSGPAVIGNVGTVRRYNYTAVGETVNVASRLESVPSLYGCQIVMGPRTAELVRAQFLLRELDWIKVKGGQGPIAVFEPVAEHPAPEQIDGARRFAEALAHYRAMRFADAVAAWDALAHVKPVSGSADHGIAVQDGPATNMAQRARGFAEHAPALPWDGVRVLTDK